MEHAHELALAFAQTLLGHRIDEAEQPQQNPNELLAAFLDDYLHAKHNFQLFDEDKLGFDDEENEENVLENENLPSPEEETKVVEAELPSAEEIEAMAAKMVEGTGQTWEEFTAELADYNEKHPDESPEDGEFSTYSSVRARMKELSQEMENDPIFDSENSHTRTLSLKEPFNPLAGVDLEPANHPEPTTAAVDPSLYLKLEQTQLKFDNLKTEISAYSKPLVEANLENGSSPVIEVPKNNHPIPRAPSTVESEPISPENFKRSMASTQPQQFKRTDRRKTKKR